MIFFFVFIVIEMLIMWFFKDYCGLYLGWLIIFNFVVGVFVVVGFGIMVYYVINVGGYDGWFWYFDNEDIVDKEFVFF